MIRPGKQPVARDEIGDRYAIERTVGHGGMASVFVAYDRELNRPVALKLLADNLCEDEDATERFKREARIAARVAHPNIVTIFDVGEEDGRSYIVMEYVEGSSLSALLQADGPFPPDRAVELVRQACAGLGHAHEAGVVHRDVKPKNMLLRDDGVLKVADFGIARAAEVAGLTRVGEVVGSPPYIAPEQMRGRDVSPATDVYGLGVLLHHLITGQSPYRMRGTLALLEQQEAREFEPLRRRAPDAPAELEEIIARCLEPSRRKRIRSTQILDRKLAALEAGDEARDGRGAGEAIPSRAILPSPEEGDAGEPRTEVLSGNGATAAERTLLRGDAGGRRRRISAKLAVVFGVIALAVGVEVAAVTLGGGSGSEKPAAATAGSSGSTPTVPTSDDPAQQARNLADWLRQRSR